MAGFPTPPYGAQQGAQPGQGGPYPYDPREQKVAAKAMRDQMRVQARAQKDAMRAQRDLYRQQARAMRRGSVLGPLLLVAVGVMLLLVHSGVVSLSEFTDQFGRWWPLLLVAGGVVLLLEWGYDRYAHPEGVPYTRRGAGGGVVFLLIVLAVGGMFANLMHGRDTILVKNMHLDADDLGELFGEQHDSEQEIDQALAGATTLEIVNPHGDVTVAGRSGDDQVHIVVNKQVYSWGGHNAESREQELGPRVSRTGDTLSVVLPQLEAASADLSITVPEGAQTMVTASHGTVDVSDVKATVTVTSNHGDVELDRIGGAVVVHLNDSGGSFSAHTLGGDLTLKGHADDLNVTDVAGQVTLEGDFYGDSHLEHLAGPVSLHTSRTEFSFAKLDGMVDISSDDELTGSQLAGPTELRTRSRNISLERVSGNVAITNSHGTVDLTDAEPLGNVSIDNQNGTVTLTVPEHAGLTLDAQTRDGGIDDDLDHTSLESQPFASHTGTYGNGQAHVTIHTTHADIDVHQGPVESPAAPAAPKAPSTPAAPAKPETPKRHGDGAAAKAQKTA